MNEYPEFAEPYHFEPTTPADRFKQAADILNDLIHEGFALGHVSIVGEDDTCRLFAAVSLLENVESD